MTSSVGPHLCSTVSPMAEIKHDTIGLYQAVRNELVAGLRSLDDATASTIVPACPEWTVKDVVAHLSGLNAELLAGVEGSIGTHEATSRQVSDRAALSMNEVLDEWLSMADAIDQRFTVDTNMAEALLADMVVHVYDLHELLHQATVVADSAISAAAHRYVFKLQERLTSEFATTLTIELSDGTSWPSPAIEGGSSLTLQAAPFEFLRGVTGRLARNEVEAFNWSADPSTILDTGWNLYGPFRA